MLVTCGKHACYTTKHGCSRRDRLLAISRSFKFPFVFHYTHMLVVVACFERKRWSCYQQHRSDYGHVLGNDLQKPIIFHSYHQNSHVCLQKEQNGTTEIGEAAKTSEKKNVKRKKQPKRKERRTKRSRKCRIPSKFGLWYKWLIFSRQKLLSEVVVMWKRIGL